ISGLPDNIYRNVKSSKPKTLDESIELANDLMDQKLRTYAERKFDSKRKADDISRNNQQPFKRQNVAKTYNLGSAEKKNYEGNAPKDCPKLNNKNGGNGNVQGWVYAVGNADRNGNAAGNPDSNIVTDTFLLNNRYASILFDTCTDRSFVSTAFSSLIDIIPTPLDNHYDVELAEGKIRLMRHHAVIVCDKKLVRVPFRNETLVFRGAESYIGRESRLTVISCSKVQEYRAKGCHVFLAQISTTKEDDKSEGKQVKDNEKEHEEHLKAILGLLKEEMLYAKFSKCKFWIPKVQFLGHVIDSRGIHVDPAKIESIKDWASPKTHTEICQFLGLAGYYRRFIVGFSKIAKSMTKLT
nr:putative reverse transcriptase domain-containing protein [Tanacetum cinerariifolium]GFB33673.1 putative reverse transcriptase domain-containing protein [Tanacetum cinerariifolium]